VSVQVIARLKHSAMLRPYRGAVSHGFMGDDRTHKSGGAGEGTAASDTRWSWPGWRGRVKEWESVAGLLRAARVGQGGMLLVEGRQGMGKTRLLHEACEAAGRTGIAVAHAVADEFGQLTPLGPLVSALGEHPPALPEELPHAPGDRPGPGGQSGPAGRRDTGGPGTAVAWEGQVGDLRVALVEWLQALLEERVAHGPLLISLDDMHWADPTTQLALRSLLPELASYPLVWILARTAGIGDPGLDRLFDLLEQDGATRVVLEPLDDRAVAEITADVLGGAPGQDVLELTAGAKGNPFLLIELLRCCRLEGTVEVAHGTVRLTSAARVQADARSRLIGLTGPTRQMLQVAGVLGRTFSVDDVAEMTGEPVDALLPGLAEAVRAGVVVPAVDRLAFRHDLLWQAVTEGISEPVRTALQRQVGEMLLRRGMVVQAAAYFMRCAQPGDTVALDGLDRAAREVLPYAPRTAADLAVRALELTAADDPELFPRSATAGAVLTAAARLAEATEFVREALRQAPPEPWASRLRYRLVSILLLSGRPGEAVDEAEGLLALPDLTAELRGATELAMFEGLLALHDFGRGRLRARAIVAERHARADAHADTAVVGALMLCAHIAWEETRIDQALRDLREAVRIAGAGSIEARCAHPRLYLARCLFGTGRLGEAETVLQAAAADIEAYGPVAHAPNPAFFRACLWLHSGRVEDAAAEAEAGLKAAEELGANSFALLGLAVLAIVELRRGDVETAAHHVERFGSELQAAHSAMFGSEWGTWAVALVGEAQGGPERAMTLLERTYTDLRRRRWMFMLEPNAAAWMTRTALTTGRRAAAEEVVSTARQMAHDNPGFPALAAAAAHAHGILSKDATALAQAIDYYRDPWGGASAAEDLGMLLVNGGADRKEAIGRLDEAAEGYVRVGALRDAARVRARLRTLGVRRRHWTYADRPTSGWESLTDTERSVADLVAQGLTNRQVAAQMFLSPHTVSFHLRQVFRKLGIGSRVELARLAVEQPNDVEEPDETG
jgi:DNA-binding CsgD family transcriptional regulator/tetratricopeptide (TPR) repeat protein